MNIYITMEIKLRELDGRMLLALAAAERGHSVILGSKRDTIGRAARGELAPGIVHEKSLTPTPDKKKRLRNLVAKGYLLTSQDEEHGLLFEAYDEFAANRYDAETVELASRIFAWGRHDGEALRRIYGTDDRTRKKFVDTGSPRVDFWRRDFAGYYEKLAPAAGLNGEGPILIVSNMMRAFNVLPFWDLVRRWREDGQLRNEESELDWYDYTCWQMRVVADFVRMVRALARAFPKTPIVIRPHPVEHEKAWPAVLGNCPNVRIIREGPLSPWIRSAKAIVHNGCTSGFEAAMSGVPVFAYTTRDTELDRVIPNRISRRIRTLDSLIDALRNTINAGQSRSQASNTGEGEAILRARFANIEGRLAADRIVDEWERLRTPVLETPNRFPRPPLGRQVRILKDWLRRIKSNDYRMSLKKFERLTDQELRTIHHGLGSSLGRFGDVKLTPLSPRAVLFERTT